MVDAGFADASFQHFTDFLQIDIGMGQPDLRHFTQLVGQILESHFLLQKLDVLNLAHRRADRLVEIGGLAVHNPIDGVSHVAHNAHILEFEQGLMGADQVQELDDLLAFLDVEDESLLALDAAGVKMKLPASSTSALQCSSYMEAISRWYDEPSGLFTEPPAIKAPRRYARLQQFLWTMLSSMPSVNMKPSETILRSFRISSTRAGIRTI